MTPQGHLRSSILKSLESRWGTSWRCIITLTSTLTAPKIWRPKLPPLTTPCRLRPPRHGTPTNIRINLIPPESRSLGYIFVANSLLSNFRCKLRKTHHLCSTVRYGRSRSSKVVDFGVNWKGLWDFLSVISSIFLAVPRTVSEIRRLIG